MLILTSGRAPKNRESELRCLGNSLSSLKTVSTNKRPGTHRREETPPIFLRRNSSWYRSQLSRMSSSARVMTSPGGSSRNCFRFQGSTPHRIRSGNAARHALGGYAMLNRPRAESAGDRRATSEGRGRPSQAGTGRGPACWGDSDEPSAGPDLYGHLPGVGSRSRPPARPPARRQTCRSRWAFPPCTFPSRRGRASIGGTRSSRRRRSRPGSKVSC